MISKIPVLSGILQLPVAARKFLLFSTINVISWQCIVGQVLVLFGRALDMPPTLIGFLISFLPFSMLLVVFTVPLVEWLGPKRLLTWSWLARNMIVASVFAMPWTISRWGMPGAWNVLLLATIGFCCIRALGVGGWFPWLHEVVPRGQDGTYFATEASLTQIVGIILAIGLASILKIGIGLKPFYLVYLLGISAGLISVIFIQIIPGGGGAAALSSKRGNGFTSYGSALTDRPYISFILTISCCQAALTWLSAASIMYLRDILGYSNSRIMMLLGLSSLGVALIIGSWGRAVDRNGGARALVQTLVIHSMTAFAWLALIPGKVWTGWAAVVVVTGSMVFNAIFLMVAARGMMCRVREIGRVGYTNIWIICSSISLGIPPILAGIMIERWHLAGFRFCFLLSGLMGLLCVFLLLRLLPEEISSEPLARV